MIENTLKIGQKVMVIDAGLMSLYNRMKRIDPKNAKLNNLGWVEEFYDNDTILVKFPIGDDDPSKHSQVAPYPAKMVIAKEW